MTMNEIGKLPTMTAGQRLKEYALLTRLDRPIGTLLLLWPTLWALWLAAAGKPDLHVLAVFVVGVFVMRSAGCAINDYADRKVDPHVVRTRQRPLAAGRLQPREAVGVFVALSLVAFALVLTLNRLTILMSFVGVALAASYPFMKRYHDLPQLNLGIAFGWGVPMAFAAQTGTVPNLAWLLFAITVIWAMVYDTMYGMVDRADDIKIGVKSTAILFGELDRALIGFLQIMFIGGLLAVGHLQGLGPIYHAGLTLAALLGLYQQYLIRGRDPQLCFRAFLNNNWVGVAIFLGIAGHYLTASST